MGNKKIINFIDKNNYFKKNKSNKLYLFLYLIIFFNYEIFINFIYNFYINK